MINTMLWLRRPCSSFGRRRFLPQRLLRPEEQLSQRVAVSRFSNISNDNNHHSYATNACDSDPIEIMTVETKRLADTLRFDPSACSTNNNNGVHHRLRRRALSKAITLVESTAPHHRQQANALLTYLYQQQQQQQSSDNPNGEKKPPTLRIGITGPPGAGKSSLIEALGRYILQQQPPVVVNDEDDSPRNSHLASSPSVESSDDATIPRDNDGNDNNNNSCSPRRPHRLAILCVDPSSTATSTSSSSTLASSEPQPAFRVGGSILGDKTRMVELTRHGSSSSDNNHSARNNHWDNDNDYDARVYIRPSPNRGHLGGVTETTVPVLDLLECAGFDILVIETVGVGQSELQVSQAVDLVVVCQAPLGGDDVQAAKRGLLETADLLVVTKADENSSLLWQQARQTAAYLKSRTVVGAQQPPLAQQPASVHLVSAHTGGGLADLWQALRDRWPAVRPDVTAQWERRRRFQRRYWMEQSWYHLWHERAFRVWQHYYHHNKQPTPTGRYQELWEQMDRGLLPPSVAAAHLLDYYDGSSNCERKDDEDPRSPEASGKNT